MLKKNRPVQALSMNSPMAKKKSPALNLNMNGMVAA
jgi:hypothetical protein